MSLTRRLTTKRVTKRVTDWLIIAVFIAAIIIRIITMSQDFSLIHVVEFEVPTRGLQARLLSDSSGFSMHDSYKRISLYSLLNPRVNKLYDSPFNYTLRRIIEDYQQADEGRSIKTAEIISVNKIPWSEILDEKMRREHIENKSFVADNPNEYLLEIEFDNNKYQALFSLNLMNAPYYFLRYTTLILLLIIFLPLILSRDVKCRWIFVLTVAMLSVYSLISLFRIMLINASCCQMYVNIIIKLVIILLYIPLFRIYTERQKLFSWVLLIAFVASSLFNIYLLNILIAI